MSQSDQASDDGESSASKQPQLKPYKQKETLRRLYLKRDLTQREIAERFGVHQTTVSRWIREHDIEKDPVPDCVSLIVDEYGKHQLIDENGDSVYVHQLLACLDYRPTEVFDPTNHVHHQMNAPYSIDVIENVRVVDQAEHLGAHATLVDEAETVLEHVFDEFDPDLGTPPETDGDTE